MAFVTLSHAAKSAVKVRHCFLKCVHRVTYVIAVVWDREIVAVAGNVEGRPRSNSSISEWVISMIMGVSSLRAAASRGSVGGVAITKMMSTSTGSRRSVATRPCFDT